MYLIRERLYVRHYERSNPKKYNAFKVIYKINNNTYIINLSHTMKISCTFNMMNLYEYFLEVVQENEVNFSS